MVSCILSKFYIKPQQLFVQRDSISCCILSKFYIKPQLQAELPDGWQRCILSKFYIKPQLYRMHRYGSPCCILSKFYIKPQHHVCSGFHDEVVSYRNSTSNHNIRGGMSRAARLYLIEILHQTTTNSASYPAVFGCILSKFYIKPQRQPGREGSAFVVSYRNSTSNHNCSI